MIAVAKRLGWAVVTLMACTSITFAVTYIVPADPARTIAGPNATAETIERIREQRGLNDPMPVQFLRYLGGVVQGDLGRSLSADEPVLQLILDRLPATMQLAAAALFIWVVAGTLWGVISAAWRGTLLDRASLVASIIGLSVPSFWLGILLLWAVSHHEIEWLPLGGSGEGLVERLRHLILPAIALGLGGASFYSRVVHTQMVEVLEQDYIRTAKAKGLPPLRILFRHALKNALLPVVTLAGMDMATLLAGAVLTETVFGWPGIGHQAWKAISRSDVPVVMGTTLFTAFFVVSANLVVDVLYRLLDPRVRGT
ncbi:MAG: ABC transporter permease subunit [Armatimonadia bacterium]|nr:ABC transporter permease subunit [Armatimonadia bacterium]